MPKMKSKKSMVKRFKVKKSGKVKRNNANTSHLFAAKSKRTKASSGKKNYVAKNQAKMIKQGIQ